MYVMLGFFFYEKVFMNFESKLLIWFMFEEMFDVEEFVVCMCDGNGNLYVFGLIFLSILMGLILCSFNLLYCFV